MTSSHNQMCPARNMPIRMILFVLAVLGFAALVPATFADVIAGNRHGPNSIVRFLFVENAQVATGITTGARKERFSSFIATLNGAENDVSVSGGIHADDNGSPGALLAPFIPVLVPQDSPNTEYEFVTETIFDLAADTTYWFVIGDAPGVSWPTKSAVTTASTAPNITFVGRQAGSTVNSEWTNMVSRLSFEIRTAPAAALSNMPTVGEDGTMFGTDQFKAVGFNTGDEPAQFVRMTTIFGLARNENLRGASGFMLGGIHENDNGRPGLLLAAFNEVIIPATLVDIQPVFTPVVPITLEANTTYWFVLGTDSRDIQWRVAESNALPAPAATLAGYLTTTDGGVTWSSSNEHNAVDIELAQPLLANIPALNFSFSNGTLIGTDGSAIDALKAVGFTIGSDHLERLTVSATMFHEGISVLDVFGSVHADNAGEPGELLATFNPVPVAGETIQQVDLSLQDLGFVLEPNTKYWIVLDGEDSNPNEWLNWLSPLPTVDPTPAPGIAFDGYLVTSDGGATWSEEIGISNAVSISARPSGLAALHGDLNCDGAITVSDIGPFVLALTDATGYVAQFPDCDVNLADANEDGSVTVTDIGFFVALLTAS
ncbi:MAG: choice-of-anchor R domain-containing protein [Phycisphaerae bacterium]